MITEEGLVSIVDSTGFTVGRLYQAMMNTIWYSYNSQSKVAQRIDYLREQQVDTFVLESVNLSSTLGGINLWINWGTQRVSNLVSCIKCLLRLSSTIRSSSVDVKCHMDALVMQNRSLDLVNPWPVRKKKLVNFYLRIKGV